MYIFHEAMPIATTHGMTVMLEMIEKEKINKRRSKVLDGLMGCSTNPADSTPKKLANELIDTYSV